MILPELAWMYGKPEASAVIRQQAEDFIVEEELNFTPSGAGEHILLYIEKQGQNTQFVAKELAQLTGLRVRDISYAGLKDRHALTRQWFCFKWPIKQELLWQQWQFEGARILAVKRHYRKLRLGALRQNHFAIRLRQVSDAAAVFKRIEQVRSGVVNYYGEQRFGINGHNLQLADQLFQGSGIADRKLRGLALSASRSLLFNLVVSARIKQDLFCRILPGDVMQLAGSGSVFCVTEPDPILAERLQQTDIHITAPLPGSGNTLVSGQAEIFEQQTLADYQQWIAGLIAFRVQAERRAIRLIPQQLTVEKHENDILLRFSLPVGCFATSVLRELVDYQDNSRIMAGGEQHANFIK